MIPGFVDEENNSFVTVQVAGQPWLAIVDSGFTGDLELPHGLAAALNPIPRGQVISTLAADQKVIEDAFEVIFPFDGEEYRALATFSDTPEILIGANLLRKHRLEIDYVARTVRIMRPSEINSFE